MQEAEVLSVEEESYPVDVECPYCGKEQWFTESVDDLYRSDKPIIRECAQCKEAFYFTG